MVDVGSILEVLSGASTIAVILGIPFIVLQMRQNARMVTAANRQAELLAFQNRAQVLLNIAEHLTDHDFILARKAVRDIVAQRNASGWEGFVDSVEGFELRAFATQYESAAVMTKLGLIDQRTLVETLGPIIVVDWAAIRPALTAFEKVWGSGTFPNFRLLADASERHWTQQGMRFPASDTLIPSDRSGPA
ncbi:MAG: DUF4760 domain-containing protein [Thermoplasmata archaeon]